MTRRQLITGEESAENLSQRISQLESQRSSLESQAGDSIGTISAPQAGYFISSVDGLESAVDVEDVENLTVAQVEELLSQGATRDSSAVGKICQDFNWYVACVFDEDDMVHLEGVDSVYLDIPFASTEQIPATVVARNPQLRQGFWRHCRGVPVLLYGFRHCRCAQRGRPGDCGYLLRGAGQRAGPAL